MFQNSTFGFHREEDWWGEITLVLSADNIEPVELLVCFTRQWAHVWGLKAAGYVTDS